MSLASELKEYAIEHGVDLIGVTSAEPFMRKKVDGLDEPLIDPRTLKMLNL
jgi:hypothetical protein